MKLECTSCKRTFKGFFNSCPSCQGRLELRLKIKRLKWRVLRKKKFNHWRYEALLPNLKKKISLEEGGTPCLSSKEKKNVFFKLEGLNPTGSFKDRGSTLEVSYALSRRAKSIVVASTGNMGASIACYAARAGMECEVIIPRTTPKEKIRQISNFGARVIKVKGSYDDAARLAEEHFSRKHDWLVGDYVLRGEGEKTVAFELADQIMPDWIVLPIGNGTMLSACWKAYNEMKKSGLLKKLPRLIGVQAKGCSTVARAFIENKEIKKVYPRTIASGIAVGNPKDGKRALQALKESKGIALEVGDGEIILARRTLARKEGIDCEPASAACYAALKKLKNLNGKIVLVLTGHGLKDLKNC